MNTVGWMALLALIACSSGGSGALDDAVDAGADGGADGVEDPITDPPGDPHPDVAADGADGQADDGDADVTDPDSADEPAADAADDGGPETGEEVGPPTFRVGGHAAGVVGTAVFLRNNAGDDLSLPAGDSDFAFAAELPDGAEYAITLHGAGDEQQCEVLNGVGRIEGAPVGDVQVTCVAVLGPPAPLHPENGADWNDYVENDGRTPLDATGAGCSGAGLGYDSCLHGGEMRVLSLDLAGVTTCAGLTAEDSAGALEWVCDDLDGVRVISAGLADGAGLSDLIDFGAVDGPEPAWRELVVTVRRDGDPIAVTTPAAWWTNPLVADPSDESSRLNVAGTLYILRTHPPPEFPRRFELGPSAVGLVVQPGFSSTASILAFGSHLWIEGSLGRSAGHSVQALVYLSDATHSRVHEVTLVGDENGVLLSHSSNNRISGLTTSVTANDSLRLDSGSHHNRIDRVAVLCQVGRNGIGGDGVLGNGFSRIELDGCGAPLLLVNSDENLLWNVTATEGYGGEGPWVIGDHNRFFDAVVENYPNGLTVAGSFSAVVGVQLADNDTGFRLGGLDHFVARVAVQRNVVGVSVSGSSHHLVDVRSAYNEFEQLTIEGSDVRVDRLVAAGGKVGVRLWNSTGVVLDEVLVAHVGTDFQRGIDTDADGVVLADATVANSGVETAIEVRSDAAVIANALVLNNFDEGIRLDASNLTVVNAAVAHNYLGVVDWSVGSLFSGDLLLDGNDEAHCFVPSSQNPGLTNLDCQPIGRSDHIVTLVPIAGSPVGKVTTDDALNPNDTDGAAAFEDIDTWLGFENPYRVWGPDGAEFPDDDQQGPCTESDTPCRIWDWRLRDDDTTLRNALPIPDDEDPDDDFIVHHVLSDGVTESPFLRNTVELHGLDGDDDGLCESDETCVVSRNFGAWQGGGNPVLIGTFDPDDGPITGVTLLADNGSTRIGALRNPDEGSPPPSGTFVRVEDVLITQVVANGLYVEDVGAGDYGGLFLYMPEGPPDFLERGMVLAVYGHVGEHRDVFELRDTSWSVLREGEPVAPAVVPANHLAPGSDTAEALESRLVELRDVTVVGFLEPPAAGPNRDAFWVSQNPTDTACSDGCALVDDRLLDGGNDLNDRPAVTLGQRLSSVIGLVDGSDGAYALQLRPSHHLVTLICGEAVLSDGGAGAASGTCTGSDWSGGGGGLLACSATMNGADDVIRLRYAEGSTEPADLSLSLSHHLSRAVCAGQNVLEMRLWVSDTAHYTDGWLELGNCMDCPEELQFQVPPERLASGGWTTLRFPLGEDPHYANVDWSAVDHLRFYVFGDGATTADPELFLVEIDYVAVKR